MPNRAEENSLCGVCSEQRLRMGPKQVVILPPSACPPGYPSGVCGYARRQATVTLTPALRAGARVGAPQNLRIEKDFGDDSAQARAALEVLEKLKASLLKFMEAHPEPR